MPTDEQSMAAPLGRGGGDGEIEICRWRRPDARTLRTCAAIARALEATLARCLTAIGGGRSEFLECRAQADDRLFERFTPR